MDTESVKNVAGLFKEITATTLIEIAVIAVLAWLAVWLSQRVIPWLANHLHGKRRLYTLALVPMLRIAILVIALLLIVPLIIEPTLQNMAVMEAAA